MTRNYDRNHSRWPRRLLGKMITALPGLGTITHVVTDEPIATLTFDDGPHPTGTPAVLEVLARHGAQASFFVVGTAVQRYPELIANIVDGGHEVANHSWDHPSLVQLPRPEQEQQIQRCAAALGESAVRLFRPPYGHQNLASRQVAARAGHDVVAWSVDGIDHRGLPAEEVLGNLERGLHPGAVILLHDGIYRPREETYADRSATVEALDRFLAARSERYCFVAVSELLACGRPARQFWRSAPASDWKLPASLE